MTRTHSAREVLPAALVLGLLLAGCGTKVAGSGSGGSADLPVLHVGQRLTGAVAGAVSPAQDPYPLVGTLPGGPSTAPVYRYADARTTEADALALAAALHVSGTPTRHAHGWEITASSGSVRVSDGDAAWSYSRGRDTCPAYAVDIDNAPGITSAVGCAVAAPPPAAPAATPCPSGSGLDARPCSGTGVCPSPGSGSTAMPICVNAGSGPMTGASPRAALGDAQALATAGPVFAALGLDVSSARVQPGGDLVRTVLLNPQVDGTVTTGASTSVLVDAHGVAGAGGVRGTPVKGPAYPIVSAQQALDWLRSQPQPEIAIACAIGQTCPGIGPHEVTGATLGLMSAFDDTTHVLIPAWLFTIKGYDAATPVVAVATAYLADPTGSSGKGGGSASAEPGSSGGAGGEPGSTFTPIPPAAPVTPPDAGAPGTTPHPLPIQSVSLGKDGATLVLHAVGGVCEDYAATADESGPDIKLTLTGVWNKGAGMMCPAIAKEFTVVVGLATPWNHRTVIDVTTGSPLSVG